MKAIIKLFIALSLCLLTVNVVAEEISLSVKNPVRAYGYTIGDVLEQTIELHDGEMAYTVQTLPVSQREGRWLTRQRVELQSDGQRLNIRYQIVNSPTTTRLITLPALTLVTDQGKNINVSAWPFSTAPLMPSLPTDENTLPTMQADWKSDLPSSSTLWRNMKVLIAAILIIVLLWLVWWIARGMREAGSLPFANAYRTIRQHQINTNNDAPKWLALHRAFDHMCGRRVSLGSIDALVDTAEWMAPFESDIRTFYNVSSERFFSTKESQASLDLNDLSKRLYLAEKRNTSKLDRPTLTAHSMS